MKANRLAPCSWNKKKGKSPLDKGIQVLQMKSNCHFVETVDNLHVSVMEVSLYVNFKWKNILQVWQDWSAVQDTGLW